MSINTLVICLQSWGGVHAMGIFYGWGALIASINSSFNSNSNDFSSDHGIFSGILLLFFSSASFIPLRILIAYLRLTDFTAVVVGSVMLVASLALCGIAIQYKILALLYIGSFFSGIGAQFTMIPVIYRHQLWFKQLGMHNVGSGIFGFFIGSWTVIYFLISVPLLRNLALHKVIYIYSAVCIPFLCIPIYTIGISEWKEHQASSQSTFSVIGTSEAGSDSKTGGPETEDSTMTDDRELTLSELMCIHQSWLIFVFIIAVIMPGFGIKLASYAMMSDLFQVSNEYSAFVTSMYVLNYAVGRLFGGLLAQYIGLFRAYDIIIVMTIALLLCLPATVTNMDHDGQNSRGCQTFVGLLCCVGLLYGGAMALIYSIAFEIFEASQFKPVFAFGSIGFGCAVALGGLSSSYSFSGSSSTSKSSSKDSEDNAIDWFYAMAGACGLALILLHCMTPYTVSRDPKSSAAMAEKIEMG